MRFETGFVTSVGGFVHGNFGSRVNGRMDKRRQRGKVPVRWVCVRALTKKHDPLFYPPMCSLRAEAPQETTKSPIHGVDDRRTGAPFEERACLPV